MVPLSSCGRGALKGRDAAHREIAEDLPLVGSETGQQARRHALQLGLAGPRYPEAIRGELRSEGAAGLPSAGMTPS
jgi:hypothetical protein